MTYRDYMKENGGNLSWCKPYRNTKENVYLVLNESRVISVSVNGKEVSTDYIKELAQRLGVYNQYEEWDDTYILLEDGWEEMGCSECPWFDRCEAMDDNE